MSALRLVLPATSPRRRRRGHASTRCLDVSNRFRLQPRQPATAFSIVIIKNRRGSDECGTNLKGFRASRAAARLIFHEFRLSLDYSAEQVAVLVPADDRARAALSTRRVRARADNTRQVIRTSWNCGVGRYAFVESMSSLSPVGDRDDQVFFRVRDGKRSVTRIGRRRQSSQSLRPTTVCSASSRKKGRRSRRESNASLQFRVLSGES